jgi:hypothetical protein
VSDLIVASPPAAAARPAAGAIREPHASWFAGRPRLEEILALLALVAVWLIDLRLLRVGLDAQDEGYFVEQAMRVVRGELPYRDFSTLYTPALLYLHTALFSLLGGPDVVAPRAVGLISRILLTAGLYALCRPMARPLFAVLPALYVLIGFDRLPATWEPHPGWPSATLTVLTILAFSYVPRFTGRSRWPWVMLVGALAALVFAFKQNAGVFLGLALVTFAAWGGLEGREGPATRPLRVIQWLLLAVLVGLVGWLLRPHLTPVVAGYFLVPIAVVAWVCLRRLMVAPDGRSAREWLGVAALLGVGFAMVTGPWLAVLLRALDGQYRLLGGFVGSVDQDALWFPLRAPITAGACLAGIAVATVWIIYGRRRPRFVLSGLVAIAAFAVCGVLLTADPGEAPLAAMLHAPGRAAFGFAVLLPPLAIVAGALWSLRSRMVGLELWRFRWLLVSSAIVLLTEYPRFDELHLAWSAGTAMIIGTIVLSHVYRFLGWRWRLGGPARVALAAVLIAVPVATTLPNLQARTEGFVRPLSSPGLVPLIRLEGFPAVSGVTVTQQDASTLLAAATFLRDNTAPGEPIFVYPSAPILYVLADRANPTPFAHLYPGAATDLEVQQMVQTLRDQPVRLVVVSPRALAFWGKPGPNQPLEDFLAQHYREVARFGDFRVLRQDAS